MKEPALSWKIQLVFIITGTFVGLLITAQFKNAIPSTTFPYDEVQAQNELIGSYTTDQTALKNKITFLRKEIELKQQQAESSIAKTNLDILNQLKKEIGLESVSGPGLQITLQDGPFANHDPKSQDQSLVQAADLRDIVNALFSSHAQAIAINNQRIIHSTPINSISNTILVNSSHLSPPFTINAIGDPELLLQGLKNPQALVDLQKRINAQKIQIKYSSKKNLTAPAYNGDLRLKYIEKQS
jgi:uncharacterized protein YlxW (UPF0749 family)